MGVGCYAVATRGHRERRKGVSGKNGNSLKSAHFRFPFTATSFVLLKLNETREAMNRQIYSLNSS